MAVPGGTDLDFFQFRAVASGPFVLRVGEEHNYNLGIVGEPQQERIRMCARDDVICVRKYCPALAESVSPRYDDARRRHALRRSTIHLPHTSLSNRG